jgi:Ser/Thr protein kinase RdoA (MazF antagonist)
VFPRLGGRPCDEPTRAEWLQIGRLIGRIHQVGAARPAAHRLVLGPQASARRIWTSCAIPARSRARSPGAIRCRSAVARPLAPAVRGRRRQRLLGDCTE